MKDVNDFPILKERKITAVGTSFHILVPTAFVRGSNILDLNKKYDVVFVERKLDSKKQEVPLPSRGEKEKNAESWILPHNLTFEQDYSSDVEVSV